MTSMANVVVDPTAVGKLHDHLLMGHNRLVFRYLLAPGRFCESCFERKPINKYGEFLCSLCRELPEHKLVTKTTAKVEYFISDQLLEDLYYTECRNPHYRNAAPMKLFKLADVIDCADDIYSEFGGVEAYREHRKLLRERREETRRAKIETRRVRVITEMQKCGSGDLATYAQTVSSESRPSRDMEPINSYILKGRGSIRALLDMSERYKADVLMRNNRRETLLTALSDKGMELRSDSQMCARYIDGSEDDLLKVVDIMVEMNWLHEHSKYTEIMEEKREDLFRDYYDWKGRPPPSWEFDSLREDVKIEAVSEWKNRKNEGENGLVEPPSSLLNRSGN